MNKRMRELMAKMEILTGQAKACLEGENKDVKKASELMDEVDKLKAEYAVEERLFAAEKEKNAPTPDQVEAKKQKAPVAEFAKAVRSIIQGKSMSESVGTDGGYTVPEDIQTKVNYWADVSYSLLDDIDVVPVSTNSGKRTYQKNTQVDVFEDLDENGEITNEIEAPQFERISYNIKDRAGFMPVSNDLINDSDANIVDTVTQWLGKAKVATSNAKILAIVKAKPQVNLGGGINGIKKVVNVTLGQAYKTGAKIYTNDDGLNYLDTLEDKNGRPLLNPDPTDATKLVLRCGTVVIPIRPLPNKTLASEGTKIPFIIGDLKAGIRKWDRQQMQIMASGVAVIGTFNAYKMNMTLFRAIMRDDYTEMDKDSYVYAYIDTAAAGE